MFVDQIYAQAFHGQQVEFEMSGRHGDHVVGQWVGVNGARRGRIDAQVDVRDGQLALVYDGSFAIGSLLSRDVNLRISCLV